MRATRIAAVAAIVTVVAAAWHIAGCESTKTTDSVMTIAPSSADLTASNRTVMFTASLVSSNATLVLPLVWSVRDANLGKIQSSSGLSAVYVANDNSGNNTITVRDQATAEGMASVVQ